MPTRLKLVAPWWTTLTRDEEKTTLVRNKEGQGETGYDVYLGTKKVGYVYSVMVSKHIVWYMEGEVGDGYPDRFTAVRRLLLQR